MEAKRMWINQPSKLQPLHHLNGTNVIAIPYDATGSLIYFLSGTTISMRANNLWLSEGWIS
jgi:hypothetical protein